MYNEKKEWRIAEEKGVNFDSDILVNYLVISV